MPPDKASVDSEAVEASSSADPYPDVARPPLWVWAHGLPKLDLHRHLEGSLRLSTLVDLVRENDIALPHQDVEALRPYVQVVNGDAREFAAFLEKFETLRRFYVSPEVMQRVVREAVADAAQDHVVYLELRFNPLALAQTCGFVLDDVVAWVIEAAAQAQAATRTRTVLLLQIPRDEPLTVAEEIVDIAIHRFGDFVRGIDLAGDEIHYPSERFIRPFLRAYDAGLNITVHAGEALGAESVREALTYLHPQRVGHGIRAVEDAAVVHMLRERGVALEVCLTSNLHTGVVPKMVEHPLGDLLDMDLHVTLNTDDPGISATTLTDEYVLAVQELRVPRRRVYRMLRHAVEAAFLEPEEKATLRTRVRRALEAVPDAVDAFDAAG